MQAPDTHWIDVSSCHALIANATAEGLLWAGLALIVGAMLGAYVALSSA